jgi:hypothetical protein
VRVSSSLCQSSERPHHGEDSAGHSKDRDGTREVIVVSHGKLLVT